MDATRISFETKCVCYLSVIHKRDGNILHRAPCSGFFWRHNGSPFLITNRHCITGKDQLNRPVSEFSFEPTHVQIYFWERLHELEVGIRQYRTHAIEANLYQLGVPEWHEHNLGPQIDVVAIALDQPEPISVDCINDRSNYVSWRAEAGADCYVVGYPEGLGGAEGTAIWKRASIASEPEWDVNGQPIFLIDSATREGMSGSPVFGKALGLFDQDMKPIDPYSGSISFLGSWPIFLGVYSGRNGDEKAGFQLGRVWKAKLLEEMLSDRRVPDSPFRRISPITP